MSDHIRLQPGTVFARDFRVVRPLEEGGMGAVYVAEQLSTGTERALKVMHPALLEDARSRERFAQEARVGARIESDHVVQVVAAGVDEASGVPWLAMELLRGETLAAAVERRGRLPVEEVAEIFRQAGHALALAHAAGLVHRDLKPENVFLCAPRRAGVPFTVKILDFGIAKVLQESKNAQGNATAMLGSPMYMSPEQATAAPIGPPADVWALGLIAFYLLTGQLYWRTVHGSGATVQSLIAEFLLEPLEPASTRAALFGVDALLPRGFDAWFGRCVARDPVARFADAGAAVTALLGMLPVSAAATPSPFAVFTPPMGSPPGSGGTGPQLPLPGPGGIPATQANLAFAQTGGMANTPPPPFGAGPATPPTPFPTATPTPMTPAPYAPYAPAPVTAGASFAPFAPVAPAVPSTMAWSPGAVPGSPPASYGAATAAPARRGPRALWVLGGLVGVLALGAGGYFASQALTGDDDDDTPPQQQRMVPPGMPQNGYGQPVVPTMPTMPTMPVAPSMPVAPAMPVAPTMPTMPAMPAMPVAPAMPVPSAVPSAAGRALRVRSGSGGAIFDDHTTTATALVRESCTVGSLAVTVSGRHTYFSDLVVRLRGPSGATATLQEHSSSNPFRRYTPSHFEGTDAAGTWTLTVADTVRADSGRLNNFTLNLTCR